MVNFEFVDHGFINHWLILLLCSPFGMVYAGYFVCRVNCGLHIQPRSEAVPHSELWFGYFSDFPPIPGSSFCT